MKCPFCDADMSTRELHVHLADDHADKISTEEAGERIVYTVTCPHCGDSYRRPIKKAVANPEFLSEFERQIQLVAFDMLIHHLRAEHDVHPFVS